MCTICFSPYVQVHHIDGNPDNDDLDNLTVLCQMHHEKAQTDFQTKTSTIRKLTSKDLKHYRDTWIERCEIFGNVNWVNEKEEFKKEIIEDFVKKVKELGLIK